MGRIGNGVDVMPEKCDWISVEERFPDESDIYIVSGTNPGTPNIHKRWRSMAYWNAKLQYWDCAFSKHVTHWRPLPDPPEEQP